MPVFCCFQVIGYSLLIFVFANLVNFFWFHPRLYLFFFLVFVLCFSLAAVTWMGAKPFSWIHLHILYWWYIYDILYLKALSSWHSAIFSQVKLDIWIAGEKTAKPNGQPVQGPSLRGAACQERPQSRRCFRQESADPWRQFRPEPPRLGWRRSCPRGRGGASRQLAGEAHDGWATMQWRELSTIRYQWCNIYFVHLSNDFPVVVLDLGCVFLAITLFGFLTLAHNGTEMSSVSWNVSYIFLIVKLSSLIEPRFIWAPAISLYDSQIFLYNTASSSWGVLTTHRRLHCGIVR